MQSLLDARSVYLVGIKGVGMTSLAQCLLDAGVKVSGTDVARDFVTQPLLNKLKLSIDVGFTHQLDPNLDYVIYGSAHQGINNPLVMQAEKLGIPSLTLAEALAIFFNQQTGVAVCGVGGKSTVSAMLSFVMSKIGLAPSYSVGVGRINGLERTGVFNPGAKYFIAEADEYAANPQQIENKLDLIPRFKYLEPEVVVCTNLKFDHPDVYQDFTQTQEVFQKFFQQLEEGGVLVINADDENLVQLTARTHSSRPDIKVVAYGESIEAGVRLVNYRVENGQTIAQIEVNHQKLELILTIPGKFNLLNALACVAVCAQLRLPLDQVFGALAKFASTQRRLEKVGEINGVIHFDDYAHHPSQITQTYQALSQWHDPSKILFAFQPHTYSRTKALFTEFVAALSQIENLVLMDVFPSARESVDLTISSLKLAESINQQPEHQSVSVVKDQSELITYYHQAVSPGWLFVTVGAGDIYQVHQLLLKHESNHT